MQMELSPQSEAVVECLLSGESKQFGNHLLGPLDQPTRTLLDVLISHFEDLNGRKGKDQARSLRSLFLRQTEAEDKTEGGAAPVTDSGKTGAERPVQELPKPTRWRLKRLRCQSIRGVAPPGETFAFDLHGESNLIYGPNGSGKSSLLGAIVWTFTGKIITDCARDESTAPVYQRPIGKKRTVKLREWPPAVTLPRGDEVTAAKPDCWAEVLIASPNGENELWIKRTFAGHTEYSEDGATWRTFDSLREFGIEPLDLQLSLIAPTVFGRRSIEEAKDTRSLLSLMLGYDDLEQLGTLASKISGNRTRLEKDENESLEAKLTEAKKDLGRVPEQLPESSQLRREIETLAKKAEPSLTDMGKVLAAIDRARSTAEGNLVSVLGLQVGKGTPRAGIADKLTVATAEFEKGVWDTFPSLGQLRLETALPPQGGASPGERLHAMKSKLAAFFSKAKTCITRRAQWWEKETAEGSKLRLLRTASEFYVPASEKCPVCDKRIENASLRKELLSLQSLDPELCAELRSFFGGLSETLSKIVPSNISALAADSVSQRITSDWAAIKDQILGDSFAELASRFETPVGAIAQAVPSLEAQVPSVLPEDANERFVEHAESFLADLADAWHSIALLEWAGTNVDSLMQRLTRLVLRTEDEDAPSLYALLAKGKDAAAAVRPLAAAKDDLRRLHTQQEAILAAREQVECLRRLAAPLDTLKSLSKYAESQIQETFELIRESTVENLELLYPESATGMKLGDLRMGKGRDKSIEALLSTGSYQVPGQFYANAGLQRAVALSFYFALLDDHPQGLGFILMDDPILSLDEDHRERWSARVLRPRLADVQVVLATHQRQYLKNCEMDFSADRVVELNPRDRMRRISWHPGDRLKRARQLLTQDWQAAKKMLRPYREDVLESLDSYSPEPFFDPLRNLKDSFKKYADLRRPHPLAGSGHDKIVRLFKNPTISRVLDPSMHSMTEDNVTRPMAEDCLRELENGQRTVVNELRRLESERRRTLRGSIIHATVVAFDCLSPRACWSSELSMQVLGAAAARSEPWVVDIAHTAETLSVPSGAAVLVVSNSLEPVARFGQWVLLADESVVPEEGDLVATKDADGNRFLRRIWSSGQKWLMQGVNPVEPVSCAIADKRSSLLRRIVGVLYEPRGTMPSQTGNKTTEWFPDAAFSVSLLNRLKAVEVVGHSLAPLARRGQKVLVGEPITDRNEMAQGEIAVVETEGEDVGIVIKQVFRTDTQCVLVSPNPVDRLKPEVVTPSAIRRIWPVRGVLFETR